MVGLLLLIVVLFFYFDLSRFLNLEYLKASQNRFQQLYGQHRFVVIGIYMLTYIVVTTLSLPGAAVMTLDADFRIYRMHGRQRIPVIMPDS